MKAFTKVLENTRAAIRALDDALDSDASVAACRLAAYLEAISERAVSPSRNTASGVDDLIEDLRAALAYAEAIRTVRVTKDFIDQLETGYEVRA